MQKTNEWSPSGFQANGYVKPPTAESIYTYNIEGFASQHSVIDSILHKYEAMRLVVLYLDDSINISRSGCFIPRSSVPPRKNDLLFPRTRHEHGIFTGDLRPIPHRTEGFFSVGHFGCGTEIVIQEVPISSTSSICVFHDSAPIFGPTKLWIFCRGPCRSTWFFSDVWEKSWRSTACTDVFTRWFREKSPSQHQWAHGLYGLLTGLTGLAGPTGFTGLWGLGVSWSGSTRGHDTWTGWQGSNVTAL